MNYDTLLVIDFREGDNSTAKVVVRRGGADDWAAYWCMPGESEQSGSLIKVSAYRYKELLHDIGRIVNRSYPGLSYRH